MRTCRSALVNPVSQVRNRVKKLEEDDKKVVKLSVTGYSLGGLIARYMIG